MNLVGKIFTVLIFVMSLVFASFAVAVYATHKNWREVVLHPRDQASAAKPPGLVFKMEDMRKRNQELKDQKDNIETDLEAEKDAAEQVRAKLETKIIRLQQELDQQEQQHAKLVQSERDAVAAMNATQATLAQLRTEVATLRDEIIKAQTARDAHFKDVVRLTDELHQAVNERVLLKDRTLVLAQDLAKAERVLRHFDLGKDMDLSGVPPPVRGIITATPQPGLCQISIGADDGIMKGHELEVVRVQGTQQTYVGRVVVVQTAPDMAVCKAIPEYMKGNIQRGDRVHTRQPRPGSR